MQNEVLTYALMHGLMRKTSIGYEISFNKYFYKPVKLWEMHEILDTLHNLEKEANGMLSEILGDCICMMIILPILP